MNSCSVLKPARNANSRVACFTETSEIADLWVNLAQDGLAGRGFLVRRLNTYSTVAIPAARLHRVLFPGP